MRMLTAIDFQANCLSILDELSESGEAITVTRDGKAIAVVYPTNALELGLYPQQTLKGTCEIKGDIISPPLPPEAWDAERGEWEP